MASDTEGRVATAGYSFNYTKGDSTETDEKEKDEEEKEQEEDYPPADATVAFLRVSKHDFLGYYFNDEPVLILPAATESEGAESENE